MGNQLNDEEKTIKESPGQHIMSPGKVHFHGQKFMPLKGNVRAQREKASCLLISHRHHHGYCLAAQCSHLESFKKY